MTMNFRQEALYFSRLLLTFIFSLLCTEYEEVTDLSLKMVKVTHLIGVHVLCACKAFSLLIYIQRILQE